jgi:arylsulfatase A-like enzyme
VTIDYRQPSLSVVRTGVLLFVNLLVLVASLAAAPRPNVLLVVNDDQGYGDASCYGAKDLQTPHFDALAASGLRFTQFRVNPLCAPTRASLLTGLSSLQSGMWRGPSQREEVDRAIQPGVKLLPQFLQEAGYATGIFGKWHLGYKSPDVPNERGFDEFVGFLGGAHPYLAGRGAPILKNTEQLKSDKHLTDLFADSAEDFIRRHAREPFFCYVPFNAVHGPLRSDDRPIDSGKPDWLAKYAQLEPRRRDYCAVLSHADDRLGRLLALLKELEIEDNTLVICLSDNGGMIDKFPGNNGPLRGAKGLTYEGGIRVPAAIRWPGQVPPGALSSANAVHFDLFATILEAAGIERPTLNGKHQVSGISLLPHAKSGAKTPLADRYLFWDLFGKMAAVHGDWKIVATIDNHHGKWDQALAAITATNFELYNLAQDVGERHNVARDNPQISEDLKQRYVAWFREATR